MKGSVLYNFFLILHDCNIYITSIPILNTMSRQLQAMLVSHASHATLQRVTTVQLPRSEQFALFSTTVLNPVKLSPVEGNLNLL